MTIINRRQAILFHYPDLQHGENGDYFVQNRVDEGVNEGDDEFYWYSVEISEPNDTQMLQWTKEAEAMKNRRLEYPSIEELTIALYDTSDKAALVTKRAAIKTKWPKDGSGPVE